MSTKNTICKVMVRLVGSGGLCAGSRCVNRTHIAGVENKANVALVANLKILNGTKGKAQRVSRAGTSVRLHDGVRTRGGARTAPGAHSRARTMQFCSWEGGHLTKRLPPDIRSHPCSGVLRLQRGRSKTSKGQESHPRVTHLNISCSGEKTN